MARKRFVAVITFDDGERDGGEDDITGLSAAASWVTASLSADVSGTVTVVAYATATDAAADEQDNAGAFSLPAHSVPRD